MLSEVWGTLSELEDEQAQNGMGAIAAQRTACREAEQAAST